MDEITSCPGRDKSRKCDLHEIVNWYPEVMENSQVHELWDASNRYLPPAQEAPRGLLDDHERILISLFNRNVLLNQQVGGFYHTSTPLSSDHQMYAKLKIKYFKLFGKSIESTFVSQLGIAGCVLQWSHKVQQFGLDHPTDTLTHKFPMSDKYRHSVVKVQAMPTKHSSKGGPCWCYSEKTSHLKISKASIHFYLEILVWVL
jgi:hypothetical protein